MGVVNSCNFDGFSASNLILICLPRYCSEGVLPFCSGVSLCLNNIFRIFFGIGESLQNFMNSSLLKMVALSETKTSGYPLHLAKIFCNIPRVEADVRNDADTPISAHFDFESTATRK